jgi:hypothetical protein
MLACESAPKIGTGGDIEREGPIRGSVTLQGNSVIDDAVGTGIESADAHFP